MCNKHLAPYSEGDPIYRPGLITIIEADLKAAANTAAERRRTGAAATAKPERPDPARCSAAANHNSSPSARRKRPPASGKPSRKVEVVFHSFRKCTNFCPSH